MIEITNEQFDSLVETAIKSTPEPYGQKLNNIGFFVEDDPTPQQRKQLGLRPCQSLFGLYEGVPLPNRNGINGNLLPDKITIFRTPHLQFANTKNELIEQINRTVWHEIAHYFGLDHDRIYKIQK
jgi:predicted Zn-dependent protease with MMP-like domain